MKSRRWLLPLLLIVAFSVTLSVSCAYRQDLLDQTPPYQAAAAGPVDGAPAHADTLEVGAARTVITPTDSLPLGGYGVYFWSMDNTRLSQDAHDPLYATAVFLLTGDDALVLIQTDLVGLVRADMEVIRDEVAAKLGIDRDRVIVTSTHTHHSPDTVGLWGTVIPARTGRSEKYMNRVKHRAIKAAVQAFRARRPASLHMAVGEEHELHWNERIQTDPDASLDSILTAVKAVDENGKVVATITNWACHPTAVGADNLHPSADWVGYFYQSMSQAMPGVHMYLNGSIGAAIQPSEPWRNEHMHTDKQSFAWAEQIGTRLAEKTVGLLSQTQPVAFEHIEVRSNAATVYMENKLFRFAKVMGVLGMDLPESNEAYHSPVTAVKLGDLRIGTMPGEVAPHLGMQIRESLGGQSQLLIGLSQDYLGYIIDEQQFDDSRYAYERMLCASPELGREMVAAHRAIAFN